MADNIINEVRYPGSPTQPAFDGVGNWPATTSVTQTTGEDITRNRDALLVLERLLGPNPHIGLFTPDVRTASVSQRIGIIEQGLAEGRFEIKNLKVEQSIRTERDLNDFITLTLGAANTKLHRETPVVVEGPLRILDSGVKDPRARFDVGIVVAQTEESGKSTNSLIQGSSQKGRPLVTIYDFNRSEIEDQDHLALRIAGNLHVEGYITGKFSLDHNRLNNINTDPVIDAQGNVLLDAIHVSRGNFHSHRRGEFDPNLGRWKVDPNPTDSTYGIIDHNDLEPESTRTSVRQVNFLPDPNVAYHVTNGDDHDHVGGDGAPLRHKFLLGIDPKNSNHVSGGDFHTHDPDKEDGGFIPSHGILLQEGIASGLTGIPIPEADPIADDANLTSLLQLIDAKFQFLDVLNGVQNERIEANEGGIEEAKITKQEFNTVRSQVTSAVTTVNSNEERVTEVEATVTALKEQILAVLFGVTITNMPGNTSYYGIGASGGQSIDVSTALSLAATYDDDDGSIVTTKNVNFTTTDATSTADINNATVIQEASGIVPRAGILKELVGRASADLPSGGEVVITLYVNYEPTELTVTLSRQDTTELPTAVVNSEAEVEVAAGDFVTLEYHTKTSTALTGVSISSAVSLAAPAS